MHVTLTDQKRNSLLFFCLWGVVWLCEYYTWTGTNNHLYAMVGGMVQNSTNQNHYQHQQPICSSTFFFYINDKIRSTSTINIIINIRNMPNSTSRENQQQQKFLFSSTTICLTTNIGHRLQQQNTFNNLGTNDWLWSREVGTQKF